MDKGLKSTAHLLLCVLQEPEPDKAVPRPVTLFAGQTGNSEQETVLQPFIQYTNFELLDNSNPAHNPTKLEQKLTTSNYVSDNIIVNN